LLAGYEVIATAISPPLRPTKAVC